MSLLSEYEKNTAWKYDPIPDSFPTHQDLPAKVTPSGGFAPFPGTTVVFRLDAGCMQTISVMQRFLHFHLGDLFAERLPEVSIHMTLHDLIAPSQEAREGDSFSEEYLSRAKKSLTSATLVLDKILKEGDKRPITMVPDRIVPLVRTSLVLILKPASEEDYERLQRLYRSFDTVVPLDYGYLPHITLAYFRPGIVDGVRLRRVVDAMQIRPGKIPDFTLYTQGITVQTFRDMANYYDVPYRIAFVCTGGMNRSVIAAHLCNQLARERGIPLVAQAWSSLPGTDGYPISEIVWETLKSNGISTEGRESAAKYLQEPQASWFTQFIAISQRAVSHLAQLGICEGRQLYTPLLYGIPDPAYETTYEEAYPALEKGVCAFLDALPSSTDFL